ncbi:uncharacterized protein LOC144143067 [Haemaphysalis longicornis]
MSKFPAGHCWSQLGPERPAGNLGHEPAGTSYHFLSGPPVIPELLARLVEHQQPCPPLDRALEEESTALPVSSAPKPPAVASPCSVRTPLGSIHVCRPLRRLAAPSGVLGGLGGPLPDAGSPSSPPSSTSRMSTLRTTFTWSAWSRTPCVTCCVAHDPPGRGLQGLVPLGVPDGRAVPDCGYAMCSTPTCTVVVQLLGCEGWCMPLMPTGSS